MRQSGSSIAVSRNSASVRANVARPGSVSDGRRLGPQRPRLEPLVEQRRERAERREPAGGLAVGGGDDEQRQAGVEALQARPTRR